MTAIGCFRFGMYKIDCSDFGYDLKFIAENLNVKLITSILTLTHKIIRKITEQKQIQTFPSFFLTLFETEIKIVHNSQEVRFFDGNGKFFPIFFLQISL